MFLGQGISVLCQGLYFILLARLLGLTEYGIYAGVFAMVAILSVYSPLGSPFTLIRHVSPHPQKFHVYWGNVLMTTVTLGSVLTGILVWSVPHLAHSYSWRLVLCVAIGDCLCGQLSDACSRVFQAFEKMRISASLNLLTNLSRTALAGVMFWRLHHVTAQQWVVFTLAVSFMTSCSALALVTRHYGRPAFNLRVLQQHLGEGFSFALSSSTAGLYNNFDKAMLGHCGMNAANGIYTMSYRVVDICTIPITSVHAAAFPRFFKKGVGGVRITTAYALHILRRTGPTALAFTVIMFLAAPMIPHLVGSSFSQSVAALRWLSLLPVFRAFHLSAGDALTGAGRLNLRVRLQAAAAAFNFAVNLYLIPHYGWPGAAWSSLTTDGLLAVANWTALMAVHSQMAKPAANPHFIERQA
jgi:O-antigen/teichoic acid export membrane protein